MALAISPIHVIGVLAGLALLYQSIRLVRDRKESIFEFLVWSGFGVGLLALSVGSALESVDVLDTVETLLSTLGFNIGRISILFVSNLLLLFLVFYAYTQIVESRKQLSDLNQEVAILRYEMENQRSDGEE